MALDTFNPYLFVSAGEQSNKFLTPAYADGIAQFQAQRAQELTGLTVRIDLIQEGTGDPSPENIRPISGRTGLTLAVSGKNLIDDSVKTAQSSSTVVIGQASTTGFDIFLPAGTYAVSFASEKSPGIYYRLSTESSGSHTVISYGNRSGTFTLTESAYLRMWAYLSGGIAPSDITWLQLEFGSTATAYEPYTAQTYPVSWQTEAGTVYGGNVDVISGKLTVTHAAVSIGSQTWEHFTSSGGYFGTRITDKSPGRNAIASCYLASNTNIANSPDMSLVCAIGNNEVYIKDSRFTVASDFIAAVGNQTICYPLATPQTYQLTPTDVKTLAGFNQIYSDAGPVIDIQF